MRSKFLIAIIICISLINTTACFRPGPSNSLDANNSPLGNTPGNIVNGGIAALGGEWAYFTHPTEHQSLYKLKLDTGEQQLVYKGDTPFFVNVVGEWIYYLNQGSIIKIKTDGTQRTILSQLQANYLHVYGDWIFFKSQDDFSINKMTIDGENITKITDDYCHSLNVLDDWIYYINGTDDMKIYKISTDGSEKVKLNDDWSDYLNVVDNWIYYCNGSDEGRLYKLDTDGNNHQKLNDHLSISVNVQGDWVFYGNFQGDYPALYKVKTDGSEVSKVSEDAAIGINIVGQWIIYTVLPKEPDQDSQMIRMKYDGSERTIISNTI